MKIRRVIRNCIWVLCAFVMFGICSNHAYAATGSVTFGSENYRWSEKSTGNPIGVYISGDEAIAEYEIVLSYDTDMLKCVEGATEVHGNRIVIRGKGNSAGYRTNLRFDVLKAGNSRIRVESATAKTVEKEISVSGNDVKRGTEDFTFTLSTAPIATENMTSSMLADLTLSPDVLKGFVTETLDYVVEVPNDVEELEVNYVLEDPEAKALLSDTKLKDGENVITIKIQGTETTTYTIYVNRRKQEEVKPVPTDSSKEPTPTPSQEVVEPSSEESASETDTSLEESEETDTESEDEEGSEIGVLGTIHRIILWGALVASLLLAVFYAIYRVKQKKDELFASKVTKDDEVEVINLDSTVIRVKNVTMKFKQAKDESSSLKEYMIRVLKKQNQYSYFTALNNISFDVQQGDVVGIIGTNGSGKSTLLKIVSGAMTPTKGKVEVDRSKVQRLTLGTGFDMELTARENVYLNGSIIGYTKEYIDKKYDDIVKFAELEGFMEERMKNFSSGMVSRLGFAIATMRDAPDILILDEVLSVGDMFFRKKSLARVKEMIHGGATVLIVSHSTSTIRENCNKVVWIEKGVLQMVGDPKTEPSSESSPKFTPPPAPENPEQDPTPQPQG